MDVKVQQITKEIDRILKKNRLSWEDVMRGYYKKAALEKDIWEELKGMWAKKKIDPLKYERKIRKELERVI